MRRSGVVDGTLEPIEYQEERHDHQAAEEQVPVVSERQLAANRRNARLSTGPRTPAGKSGSSRNAVRHGLDPRSPVIPRLEDPTAWDAHLASTIATLAPVGPLKTVLAERVATILWRLDRVARYEREITSLGRERAPADLVDADARAAEDRDEDPPDDPRPAVAEARACLRALRRVMELPSETPVSGRFAGLVLDAILVRVPDFNFRSLTIPERLPDDQFIHTFDGWTAGRLRRVIEATEQATNRPANSLLGLALGQARFDHTRRSAAVRQFDRRARHVRRERILAQPDQINRVIRYESHLTRQLDHTLAHLRQLHQARILSVPRGQGEQAGE